MAVDDDDQTLLVNATDGFHVLAVGPAADIQVVSGRASTLASIRPGESIEFSADTWAGMMIATSVRVLTDARAAQR